MLMVKEEILDIENIINNSIYETNVKRNLLIIFNNLNNEVIGNNIIMKTLNCSEATATSYIKKIYNDLHIIIPITGLGKGELPKAKAFGLPES